jgi:hypothetical protein
MKKKKDDLKEKCRWCLCRFLIAEADPKNTTARGCQICDLKEKDLTRRNENLS